MSDAAAEAARLRACLRDVGALTALFSTLHGQGAAALADALVDAVRSVLRLDLACVRFQAPDGSLELHRVRPAALDADAVCRLVGADLPADADGPVEVDSPVDGKTLRLARVPLGLMGKGGVLVAASRRPDFPTEVERFLLGTAENQATVAREVGRYARQLEDADRAKDEFIAMISHELRTPLTSILGWVRALQAGQLPPETAARALSVIERNTRAQAQLINDLLDVSRITAGKLQLDVYPVDLAPIVADAVESVRREAETKGLVLDLTLQPGLGLVPADPLRLNQVVVNLLTNAVKFTPAGGRVSVSLRRDGAQAAITVADTGPGIEAAMLGTIFEAFRQADTALARRHGGLGLGLAIARHLVDLHGGALRAESPGLGHGATFTVTLPLANERNGDGAGVPMAAVAARPLPAQRLLDRRILVVDDNHDTCDMLAAMLALEGAQVIAAASGPTGLAAFETSAPHVVLCDIAMPGMSGHDFIRELRARTGGRPRVPAVAVTAHARPDDQRRALEAGYDYYLAKPVEPATLVELLARLG